MPPGQVQHQRRQDGLDEQEFAARERLRCLVHHAPASLVGVPRLLAGRPGGGETAGEFAAHVGNGLADVHDQHAQAHPRQDLRAGSEPGLGADRRAGNGADAAGKCADDPAGGGAQHEAAAQVQAHLLGDPQQQVANLREVDAVQLGLELLAESRFRAFERRQHRLNRLRAADVGACMGQLHQRIAGLVRPALDTSFDVESGLRADPLVVALHAVEGLRQVGPAAGGVWHCRCRE